METRQDQRFDRAEPNVGVTTDSRFRELADAMPQIVYVSDASGRPEFLNRRWTEYTGITTASVADLPHIVHPDDIERLMESWRAGLASGTGIAVEFRLKRASDGAYRWFLTRNVPIRDAAGRVVRWYGTSTDIDDQKRVEETLRQSEARFRELANNIASFAWTCDQLGQATWYNQRWYDYTGSTWEEMRGDGWRSVQHPDHLARVVDGLNQCVASGEPWEDSFPLRGKDGAYRWFLSRAVPIRDEAGRIVRWFGTNTDVTEQRRLEEALREADRRKDEFLATLAHELRNPLAPIRNALQILKLPHIDAQTAGRAREIMERQVQHLVRLVDDLLDVSRVMRGKITLRTERVELAAVVARAVETVQSLIETQGHELTVALPPETLPLEADTVRLAQVVANLLTNAAKYTEPGGRIWLSAGRDGGHAVLRVRDTGVGITPEMLPKVFELFVQADSGATRAQGGLGIGLTLARSLVEMHGGTVEAHSAGLGRGAEFVVRLPLVAQEPERPAGPQQTEQPALRQGGRRVLVVDDNADAAESLAMLLRLDGHDVVVSHNGPAALKQADCRRPEVIFLDLGMPGMDGYEVARRLRGLPNANGIQLVALTGWGAPEDRRRTAEAGFDRHLVKPVEPGALEALLDGLPRRA